MAPSLFNITVSELTNLNPWIGSDCDTGIWAHMTNDGYEQVCIMKSDTIQSSSSSTSAMSSSKTSSAPMSSMSATSSTMTTSTTTSQTASGPPPPAPTQPGTSSKCQKWHTVVSGDTCYDISAAAGIALSEFYRMNPGVGSDCSALWLGYAVCIGE